MALQKSINLVGEAQLVLSNGNVIPTGQSSATYVNAYHKVSQVRAAKDRQSAIVDSYDKKGGALLYSREVQDLPVDLEGGNNIAQAYAALKELPEFADAVDC